jgi:hypothetical protein
MLTSNRSFRLCLKTFFLYNHIIEFKFNIPTIVTHSTPNVHCTGLQQNGIRLPIYLRLTSFISNSPDCLAKISGRRPFGRIDPKYGLFERINIYRLGSMKMLIIYTQQLIKQNNTKYK